MEKIKDFIKKQQEPFWFSMLAISLLALAAYIKNIFLILFVIGGFLFAYFTLVIYRINNLLSLLKKNMSFSYMKK